MRTISAEGLKAMLAEDTEEVFVMAIRLSHSSWADDFRAIRDNKELYHDAELFIPFPFEVGLPPQVESKIPTVSVAVDNIDRVLIDEIRALQEKPTAEIYVFRRSFDGTDTLEIGPMQLATVRVSYSVQSINLSLSLDADYLNEPATKDRFVPSNSPGLFS